MTLDVRDARVPAKLAKAKVNAKDGKPDLEGIKTLASELKAAEPLLTTVLIQPQAATMYETIIDVMDSFKKQGMIDLGVSPL